VSPRAGLYMVAKRGSPSPCQDSDASHPVHTLVAILTEPTAVNFDSHYAAV